MSPSTLYALAANAGRGDIDDLVGALRLVDRRGRGADRDRGAGFDEAAPLPRARPKLAKRKNDKVFKAAGKLACEACDADAVDKYGEVGAGMIDAHHTKPLHTLTKPTETSLDDLALLCPTCHRIIHASRPWLTVPELRAIIAEQRCSAGSCG